MSFSTIKAIAFTAVFAAATPLAYAQSATELEEDFSLFTAGSESEPSGAISNETGTIPSSYFHRAVGAATAFTRQAARAHSSAPTTTERSSTHRSAHTSASMR